LELLRTFFPVPESMETDVDISVSDILTEGMAARRDAAAYETGDRTRMNTHCRRISDFRLTPFRAILQIMTDTISKERRSWNMSRIRSEDTKPEMIVRSMLHRAGYRFRLHVKNLPGKPDIVLPKYKTVIFVHGCFWHRHKGCKYATTPSTNKKFWQQKFARNTANDKKHRRELKKLGWKVIIIWGCQLRKPDKLINQLQHLL